MQIVGGRNQHLFLLDKPLNWHKRGEPAEGSLNLSYPHREPTYALPIMAAPERGRLLGAQVRGWLLLVSVDLAGRVQYQLGPFAFQAEGQPVVRGGF